MHSTRFVIVGGGLSGLYAASLLEQRGVSDYVLLEARHNFGGRIVSISAPTQLMALQDQANTCDRFDLGPTWYWPDLQPEFGRLINDLKLESFAQFENGDTVVERSAHEAPLRIRGSVNSPNSMRLKGGMLTLIDALRGELDPARLIHGEAVRRVGIHGTSVTVDSANASGRITSWTTEHVLLAAPPRLVTSTIDIVPVLPAALAQQWRSTATWMAPHAKYVAIYNQAFWRNQGLSGEARSTRGPLVEIHDASMPGGSAALFGFVGVPAQVRQRMSDDVLRGHCRAQLSRLFGPQAGIPTTDAIKDWAIDPYTATGDDVHAGGHDPAAPSASPLSGAWAGRLTGISSEWSPTFPGYLAGAVDAAARGVQSLFGRPAVELRQHP